MTSLGPAVQYLAGELSVEQGTVLPLLASHNTVRMRFDMEEADYLHLAKADAAFPAGHLAMLADDARNQVPPLALCMSLQVLGPGQSTMLSSAWRWQMHGPRIR